MLDRLASLERALEQGEDGGRVSLDHVFLWLPGDRVPLRRKEADRLAQVYRQLMGYGGSGTQRVQEELLRLLGGTGSAALVPFWTELLGYTRARDPFSKKRRFLALAALAHVIIRAESAAPEAVAARVSSLGHKDAVARGDAAYFLGEAFRERGEGAPEEILDALERCARKNRALRPRYLARRALDGLGRPLPGEPGDEVYALKVWHTLDADTYRVIEMHAEQSLDALHHAIQQAWHWDADHLYVFGVGGTVQETRFQIGCPEMDEVGASALSIRVGTLGLLPRHSLLYLFDFGDKHRFTVQCERVWQRAGESSFPRVIEAVGEPMEQYPWD